MWPFAQVYECGTHRLLRASILMPQLAGSKEKGVGSSWRKRCVFAAELVRPCHGTSKGDAGSHHGAPPTFRRLLQCTALNTTHAPRHAAPRFCVVAMQVVKHGHRCDRVAWLASTRPET